MGVISYTAMADHDVFAVLGSLFPDIISSRALLEDFGADQAYLPAFGATTAPTLYWREVCRQIHQGRFPGDLDRLLTLALRQYPYNERLRSFVGLARPGPPAPHESAELRILLLLSGPTNQGRIMLTQELQLIQEAVAAATIAVSLTVNAAVRPASIVPTVLDVRPHVVHFSGHGSTSGLLAAEDTAGKAAPISAEALVQLLVQVDSIHTVLLGSCYAGAFAARTEHRFAVIGHEGALRSDAALAFSHGFYSALVRGAATARSFEFGRGEVELGGHDSSGFRLWPPGDPDEG